MMAFTQRTNTDIFVVIALIGRFKLLGGKVLFINRGDNRSF